MSVKVEDTFVLIVGGGPVGLSAAIDLAWRGVPGILITENLETATHPRCNFINARSMEHFRRLGLATELREAAPLRKIHPYVSFVTRYCGYEFGRIDLLKARPVGAGTGIGFQTPEMGITMSQLFLEPILRQRAESGGSVDVRFGWSLVSMEAGEDGAVAVVEDVRSKERRTINAKYVIAADGGRSPIRRQFGIGMVGEDGSVENSFVSGSMITYFLRAPSLVSESARPPAILSWIINHDIRAFVFAQDAGEHWIIHYQVPKGQRWEDVSSDHVIQAVFGKKIPYEIVSQGPWSGGLSLVANAYRAGPAFLLGDAAHLYTPLGGFGMNTGIGDAMNLTWKLAALYNGWGGKQLLDSYELERRPVGIRNSWIGTHCAKRKGAWEIPQDIEADTPAGEIARKTFGEFVVVDDLDEYETSGLQLGESYGSSPVIGLDSEQPLPDTWASYVPNDQTGSRAPHFWVAPDRAFYDMLGPGYTIVDFESGQPLDGLRDAAAQRGVPLTIVSCKRPDHIYRSQLVLIRPDQHIAWRGDSVPSDPLALMDLVRGA